MEKKELGLKRKEIIMAGLKPIEPIAHSWVPHLRAPNMRIIYLSLVKYKQHYATYT